MFKPFKVMLTSGGESLLYSLSDAFNNVAGTMVGVDDILDKLPDNGGLLFIDWLLPTIAGLQLLQLVRRRRAADRLHITMVFPQANEQLFARAIEAGADDYVVGPLTPQSLVDRVRLYIPRSAPPEPPIRLGELVVEPDNYVVRWRDEVVRLHGTELRLLMHFAHNPNRVLTREKLLDLLELPPGAANVRKVDGLVSRLRAQLKAQGVPVALRTVRSFGYIYDCDEAKEAGRGHVPAALDHQPGTDAVAYA